MKKAKKFDVVSIIKKLKILDVICIMLGIASIGYGLYLIYPPAMFIVIGCILAFPGLPRKNK
jgi:hypothetical protein